MSTSAVARDPRVQWRGLTRGQYDALVDAGVLDGEPVQLLGGVLVEMSPQSEPHARAVTALTRVLIRSLPGAWDVRPQCPLAVSDDSEPEPDLAVVARSPATAGRPTTAALVVEVTVSSHRPDLLHKPGLYAAADIDEYWVLDLAREEVVVHTGPGPAGYRSVSRRPWAEPRAVLGVRVDLAAVLTA